MPSIKNSRIHHFTDDTNLLYASTSPKDFNKKINFDLSNLVQWLWANKVIVNVNKTDILMFLCLRWQITKKMNFHLSGQKIKRKKPALISRCFSRWALFKNHINTLKQKLNRADSILAKLRHHFSSDIFKTVYYSFFDTHLHYACQVLGQSNSDILIMVQKAQNKVLRIINFKEERHPGAPLFTETKILILLMSSP